MTTYDELELLAAKAEREGGYVYAVGDDEDGDDRIEIGDVKLEGRDIVSLLQHMLRRSQAREAELMWIKGYGHAAAEQAQRDARREVLAAVREATERFE